MTKLLFDQNLAARLVELLADVFPASQHVRHLGMQEASDEVIFRFARANGFTLVSKDWNFHHWGLGLPPLELSLRRAAEDPVDSARELLDGRSGSTSPRAHVANRRVPG